MIKRLFLLFALLLIVGTVVAQDTETDTKAKIPFVQLNGNFSVPEINWVTETGDNFVWFVNREINAQIYVTVVDTQDVSEAISQTIPTLSNDKFDAPFLDGIAARTTGTWTVQLFESGDTSISAYGMLQSGKVYVVLFAESSPNYKAYNYPIRPEILVPAEDEVENMLISSSDTVLKTVLSQDVTDAEISYPSADNSRWILAQYSDTLATTDFLYDNLVFVTMVDGDTSSITTLANAFDTVFLGFVITPDNSEYLYLGLTFASVIMLALLGSMWLRYKNVQKDMALLEELRDEE